MTGSSRNPVTTVGSGEGPQSDSTNIRTALSADAIAKALLDNLHCRRATTSRLATRTDWYLALAYTVRDRVIHRFITSVESLMRANQPLKGVAYLSAEFLTGPHLGNS